MQETVSVSNKPNIIISNTDLERLETLLESIPAGRFPGMDELMSELCRAEVLSPQDMPPNVVTMNSTVRFRVDGSTDEFCLTLVYPRDLDGSNDKISVLAPVGSALIGLSEGAEIEWPKPGGGTLRVRIEEVINQPERRGEYHR